ncbi:hypothetical protein HW115_19635, partial [Verrucomicrobiaceae bacterium N1E253]
ADPGLPEGVSPTRVVAGGDGYVLNNGLLEVKIDSRGLVTGMLDLENLRQVIADGGQGNLLQIHKDYPNRWNAWDVDVFYKDQVENLDGPAEVE